MEMDFTEEERKMMRHLAKKFDEALNDMEITECLDLPVYADFDDFDKAIAILEDCARKGYVTSRPE